MQSLVTIIDRLHVLAADTAAGHALIARAQSSPGLEKKWAEAGLKLRVTWVPDQICSNVLRIRYNVVMQKGEK
jgi:hypothetical protein